MTDTFCSEILKVMMEGHGTREEERKYRRNTTNTNNFNDNTVHKY